MIAETIAMRNFFYYSKNTDDSLGKTVYNSEQRKWSVNEN